MIVYEIFECEEYEWQFSHGLYSYRTKAIADAIALCRTRIDKEDLISSFQLDGVLYVLKGDWTQESFTNFKRGDIWWWYRAPFNHSGAFCIIAQTVNARSVDM